MIFRYTILLTLLTTTLYAQNKSSSDSQNFDYSSFKGVNLDISVHSYKARIKSSDINSLETAAENFITPGMAISYQVPIRISKSRSFFTSSLGIFGYAFDSEIRLSKSIEEQLIFEDMISLKNHRLGLLGKIAFNLPINRSALSAGISYEHNLFSKTKRSFTITAYAVEFNDPVIPFFVLQEPSTLSQKSKWDNTIRDSQLSVFVSYDVLIFDKTRLGISAKKSISSKLKEADYLVENGSLSFYLIL